MKRSTSMRSRMIIAKAPMKRTAVPTRLPKIGWLAFHSGNATSTAAAAGTVADRYRDLLDGYVIDHADMAEVVSIDARVTLAQTLMTTLEDREALAQTVLDEAAVLRRRK